MDSCIVICTYNRAKILGEILKSLCNQKNTDCSYSIIVIDNASSDNTKEIVELYASSFNISYAYEPKLGLSYARNLGIKLAESDYIAYLDDDSRPTEYWLASVITAIKKDSPDICGGPVFPFYEDEKPIWFLDKYATFSYWGNDAHPLKENEYLSGNNIIFRKKLLQELGGFNPKLGMSGNKLGFHEEAEIVHKTRKLYPHAKILYDPKISISHLVPKHKMSLRWAIKRSYYITKSDIALYQDDILHSEIKIFDLLKNALFLTLLLIYKSSIKCLFRNKLEYPYSKNYFMETIIGDPGKLLFKNWHLLLFIFQERYFQYAKN